MTKLALILVTAFVVVGAAGAYAVNNRSKLEPKPISDIMETAMKGGLAKKVASGDASEKEKLELLNLVIDLVENEPPKGDPTQWKMMAGKVMMDAAKAVVGREEAGEQLAQSTNCKACHDIFKP